MAETEKKTKEEKNRAAAGALTAEDYRKKAQEHQDAIKDQWKIFGKVGIFLLAAAIALVILGIAWFASNQEVTATGMSVAAAPAPFELAAEGSSGRYDSDSLESGFTIPETTSFTDDKGTSHTGYVTVGSATSLSWAVSADDDVNKVAGSNMKNTSKSGIQPGTSGEMVFYIIPGQDGNLTVNLQLSLEGLVETKNEESTTSLSSAKESSDENAQAAQQLLEGHVLLFAEKKENTSYDCWISQDGYDWNNKISYGSSEGSGAPSAKLSFTRSSGKLTWTGSNLKAGTAYPVTIYWVWPEVLGQFIFTDGSCINGRPVLFPDSRSTDNLFEKMATVDTTATSNRYFKWASVEDFHNTVTKDKLSTLRDAPDLVKYNQMCAYYNEGDQYLGEKIRYVRLRLDAE